MTERMWHQPIAGDPDDAVRHGLTLKARCGLVWVPEFIGGDRDDHPEIEDCPDCRSEDRQSNLHDPEPTYVYRYYDAAGRLLYVGCTRSPKQRDDQHRATTWWYPEVDRTRRIVFPTRSYALAMERQAIAEEAPLWNVRGQDRSVARSLDDYRHMHALMERYGVEEKRIHKVRLEALRHHDVDLTVEATA